MSKSRKVLGIYGKASYGSTPDDMSPPAPSKPKIPSITHPKSKKSSATVPPSRKEVSCALCSQVLADKFKLKRHMAQVHDTGIKLECDICGKKVAGDQSHLRQHKEARHAHLKPHSCHLCPYKGAQPVHLRNHLKSKHPEDADP